MKYWKQITFICIIAIFVVTCTPKQSETPAAQNAAQLPAQNAAQLPAQNAAQLPAQNAAQITEQAATTAAESFADEAAYLQRAKGEFPAYANILNGDLSNKETSTEAILETYKKILHNEASFKDENNDDIYLSFFQHDQRNLNFSLFAVVDMNLYKDGIPELVLHNTSNGDTLVLHYYNGAVYGKEYGYRAMRDLKKDGFFDWSNSAYNSGIGILHITETDQEIINMAEYGSLLEQIEMYRIKGNPVNQEEFNDYSAFQHAKEDIVWHELTVGNINKVK